ncbi:hypothetical protein CC1G_04432 [Coprinopsis cinerea okayama7|uniref:Protein yippee-like n=1 Tax=Coprinopsis cinerea (strain Okayama-7 / 130 / ATCC MYA-4618 / FGSC 9003) TaxID=240176 RepID=A8N0L1_COPC7|nr:hypothetical protein CC1G_04432 [Coprinopsis cinerea okayama7\|eukprot:XP_001828461.2 hypothetical protein CC1G_04432 [Coprinopsis cinerea okayama7\
MGMTFRRYLNGGGRIYGCSNCKTHLASLSNMMSRAFNGQHGRAYLFESVVNVTEGEECSRAMTTGQHTVRDIYCVKCGVTLGWKYAKKTERSRGGGYREKRTPHLFLDGVFIVADSRGLVGDTSVEGLGCAIITSPASATSTFCILWTIGTPPF